MEIIRELKSMNLRTFVMQTVAFALVIGGALFAWRCAGLYLWVDSPIVVVLTGSMEPNFYRGDLLFLYHSDAPYEPGDIVVYTIGAHKIPIVHRVTNTHTLLDKRQRVLTKGDNNNHHDHALYDKGVSFLTERHLMARIALQIPYIGVATILINDYPILKYLTILAIALTVIVYRD